MGLFTGGSLRTVAVALALVSTAPDDALAQRAAGRPPAARRRRRVRPRLRNVVTVDPLLAVLGGTLNVQYERVLSRGVGFVVGPQLVFSRGVISSAVSSVDQSLFGLGLVTGLRFYPSGRAPRGLFLSPEAAVAWVTASSGSFEGTGWGASAAALIGYQWVLGGRFVVAIAAGLQYTVISVALSSTSLPAEPLDASGFGPTGRFLLGTAF